MSNLEEMSQAALAALERRALFKKAGTGVAGAIAAAALANSVTGSTASAATTAQPLGTPTATDVAILNFALNLEYLEAQFYLNALLGTGLSANDLAGGAGTASSAPGGYTYATPGATPISPVVPAGLPGPAVSFATPIIRQFAQTIAADELSHVRFIKSSITALGGSPVPAPVIDVTAGGAFSTLATAAGIIGKGQVFNPYQDENAFLLGAYIFEDVGVTAYGGAAALISQASALVQYAASILAVEAYHAGTIRTLLAIRGGGNATDAISNARSVASSGAFTGTPQGDDYGTLDTTANVVVLAPLDGNALTYRRSVTQVLNIVYGSPTFTATPKPGLFFPNGTNSSAPGFS